MNKKKSKPITSIYQGCFGQSFKFNKILRSVSFVLTIIVFSDVSGATDLSTARMKDLVMEHSKNTRHVDLALGLAVVRVMSNFDPDAIGPAQRFGLFQLDPYRLEAERRTSFEILSSQDQVDGKHSNVDLLDPILNTRIGLTLLDQLIEDNNGDIAMALVEFNDGNQLGPWPSSRVIRYPGGFVANVFAARAVFEKKLSTKNRLSDVLNDASLYELDTGNYIYPAQELRPDLPRWRKKIAETLYWLDEVKKIKRTVAFKNKT